MVGTNKQLASDNATYLRKIRKPMIEKKRRERINHSITQLRTLIDDTLKRNIAPMTRIDKADILELTVCHLRNHRRSDIPTNGKMSYEVGFKDCARQVTSFLVANGLIDANKLIELNCFLGSISGGTNCPVRGNKYTSTPNRSRSDFSSVQGTRNGSEIQMLSPIQQRSYYGTNHSTSGCKLQDQRFGSTSTFDITQNSLDLDRWGNLPRVDLHMLSVDGLTTFKNTSLSSFEDSSSSFSSSQSTFDINQGGYADGRTSSIITGSGNKSEQVASTTWRPW